MTRQDALYHAYESIPNILPLQQDEIEALCEQILIGSPTPEIIANRFMDFLGQEDLALNFISKFNELLSSNCPEPIDEVADQDRKNMKDTKQLISSKLTPLRNQTKSTTITTADSAEKKKTRKSKKSQFKESKLQSLQEIDDVVRRLEVDKKSDNSNDYKCDCQGNRHPLFEISPNCLSCGKIICVREGLHLSCCTFCGEPLIPDEERVEMLNYLKQKKEELTNDKDDPKVSEDKAKKPKSYKVSTGRGKNLFTEQNKMFDLIERRQERERKRKEVLNGKISESSKTAGHIEPLTEDQYDSDLVEAQKRLETLLHFQDTSAERTKVIDNASDFSISGDVGLWGSAKERALLLKKQQRNLKKWEIREKERTSGKDKVVVSMDIKPNGKVSMEEVVTKSDFSIMSSDEEKDGYTSETEMPETVCIKDMKDDIKQERNLENIIAQSKRWDYREDRKKLVQPIYINQNFENVENSFKQDIEFTLQPKVQLEQTDDDSLEHNILAVL